MYCVCVHDLVVLSCIHHVPHCVFFHNATEAYLDDDMDDIDDPFGDIPFSKLPFILNPCQCYKLESDSFTTTSV